MRFIIIFNKNSKHFLKAILLTCGTPTIELRFTIYFEICYYKIILFHKQPIYNNIRDNNHA